MPRPAPARGCPARRSWLLLIESQPPYDHLTSHLEDGLTLGEGVGPKRAQRHLRGHLHLLDEHARRLVDLQAMQFGPRLPIIPLRAVCPVDFAVTSHAIQ